MTSRRVWNKPLLLATVTAGLGTLFSASGHAGPGAAAASRNGPGQLNDAPACSGSQRFCYGAPLNLGPFINTPQFDGGPSISADGLTLYFTSGRPGALGQAESHYDEDLYVSTRLTVGDPFEAPIHLPAPVSSTQFDVAPEISADGLSLYFVRGSSFPEFDIYVSKRLTTADPWQSPRRLGPNVNTPFHDGILSISADSRTLYWSSDRPGGMGGFDIWYSTRPGPTGEFGPAINLSELNTPFDDFAPEIAANNKVLYFASSRPAEFRNRILQQLSLQRALNRGTKKPPRQDRRK